MAGLVDAHVHLVNVLQPVGEPADLLGALDRAVPTVRSCSCCR